MAGRRLLPLSSCNTSYSRSYSQCSCRAPKKCGSSSSSGKAGSRGSSRGSGSSGSRGGRGRSRKGGLPRSTLERLRVVGRTMDRGSSPPPLRPPTCRTARVQLPPAPTLTLGGPPLQPAPILNLGGLQGGLTPSPAHSSGAAGGPRPPEQAGAEDGRGARTASRIQIQIQIQNHPMNS